jgi:hypothetical protein
MPGCPAHPPTAFLPCLCIGQLWMVQGDMREEVGKAKAKKDSA